MISKELFDSLKTGDKVTCKIYTTTITDAKVYRRDKDTIYICQNDRDGCASPDMMGYQYSYVIYTHYCKDDFISDLKVVQPEPVFGEGEVVLISVNGERWHDREYAFNRNGVHYVKSEIITGNLFSPKFIKKIEKRFEPIEIVSNSYIKVTVDRSAVVIQNDAECTNDTIRIGFPVFDRIADAVAKAKEFNAKNKSK